MDVWLYANTIIAHLWPAIIPYILDSTTTRILSRSGKPVRAVALPKDTGVLPASIVIGARNYYTPAPGTLPYATFSLRNTTDT
jgi:hypothetical protein